MDKIIIKDLEVFCNHGVYEEEKRLGQKFIVSMELKLDLKKAAKTGELGKTVNYGELCHDVEKLMKEETHDLIETVADNICKFTLLKHPEVKEVNVTLKKPWAPIKMPLEYAAVSITRKVHRAYLGLGSNIGDKKANIEAAIELLHEDMFCSVTGISKFYETAPVGYTDQDDFVNAAIEVITLMEVDELMEKLLDIENQLKRERVIKWGPRTIDMDILLYDDMVSDDENTIIPHPRMTERMFVLEPLCDIAPNYVHPLKNKRIFELKGILEKENQ